MLNSGEVFAGFTVERLLGQGGMGSVYLARHPRLNRQTALKLLSRELFTDAEVRARFEREADLAAHLDHPNIVAVYDRGSENEQLWISMQYIDGVDAATVDPRTLPPERAVQIIEGVAGALDYAHGMGVLHRDVKPANFMLARSGGGHGERVFLTDFGIARLREDSTHLTQDGMFSATLAYASPEQMTGAELDNRTDQYSLACALYWLFTGMAPFDAPDPNDIIRGHLQLMPAPLATRRQGVNPAMDQVLAKAMAKRPEHRFSSCAEFAVAARQALTAPVPPQSAVVANPNFTAAAPAYPGPGQVPPGFPPPVPVPGAATSPDPAYAPPPNAGYAGAPPVAYPAIAPPPSAQGAAPMSAAPMSAGAVPPPYGPSQKQRRGAATWLAVLAIGLVLAVVIAIGALAVVGMDSMDGEPSENSSAEPGISGPPAAAPPDPHAESRSLFPTLVPQGRGTFGDAYQGANCSATRSAAELRMNDESLRFSRWVSAWTCDQRDQTTTQMSYIILEFAAADDARSAVDALPPNQKSTGSKDGVPVSTHRWIVADPPDFRQPDDHTVELVVSFEKDSARANYLVYVSNDDTSDGLLTTAPSAQDALTAWWDGAPL